MAPFTHRQILGILAGLMAGLFLAALDQTIVATALPTIVGELSGLNYYSWVVTAYLLSSTVCTPLYGKVSDIYGRRVTYQAAVLIFLAGSLLAGISPSMFTLVLSRGVQGLGAGGVMALTFAVIGDIVSPRQRGRYIGYLGGVWALASLIGPLLGGFIVDQATWRWVFLINLPVGGLAFMVISRTLRMPVVVRPTRLDLEGALLLVSGVSLLLLALVWGGAEYPWNSWVVVGSATVGLMLTIGFVTWEAHVIEPLLPLRLFKSSIFSICSALGFLTGLALFGAVVFLPLWFQVVTGVSATSSGLLVLPLTAGTVIGSMGSGRLTSWTGRYKVFPRVGGVLAVTGMCLLGYMDTDTAGLAGAIYMGTLGLGVGMVLQVSLLAVQNAVHYRDLGVATSSAQFFRSMGGSFGVALFGAIMNARLEVELPRQLSSGVVSALGGDVTSLLSSPESIRALPDDVAGGVAVSLAAAIQEVFLWAALISVLVVVLSWFLKEIPLRDTVGPESTVEVVDGVA